MAKQNEDTFEQLSLEEAMDCLEETLQQMEQEEISLEDAFACYEKGIRLIAHCNATVDRVEKKLITLTEEAED